jgi:hypothetical protein
MLQIFRCTSSGKKCPPRGSRGSGQGKRAYALFLRRCGASWRRWTIMHPPAEVIDHEGIEIVEG